LDLLHRPVLDLQHPQDQPILGFQTGQEVFRQLRFTRLMGAIGDGGFTGQSFEDVGLFLGEVGHPPFRPVLLGADGIEAMIDGDPGDPVFNGNLALILAEMMEDAGEDFLGEILLGGAAGKVGPDDPQDEWIQSLNQFAGGLLIVPANPLDAFGRDGGGGVALVQTTRRAVGFVSHGVPAVGRHRTGEVREQVQGNEGFAHQWGGRAIRAGPAAWTPSGETDPLRRKTHGLRNDFNELGRERCGGIDGLEEGRGIADCARGVGIYRIWGVAWMRALVRIYRGDWPRVVLALGLAVLTTGAGLVKPWPLARLVDGWAAGGGVASDTARWVGLLFVVYAAHAALGSLLNLVLIQTGLRGLRRIRQEVFDWLLGLSLRRLLGRSAGDLIYRATWDTCAFQTLFQQGLFTFLTAGGSLVAMTVIMWRLNTTLAWVALATVPPLLLVMQVFGKGIGKRSTAAQASDSRLAERFQQILTHLPVVQSFTAEDRESAVFATDAETALEARGRQHRFELVYLAGVGVVFAAGTAAIVWFGSKELAAGRITLGTFLVFLAYLAQFYEPLQQLSHVGTTVSNAGAGARRVLELLEQSPEPRPPARPVPLPTARGAGRRIEFIDVGFAYEPGQPVLEGLRLIVEPGEAVAIVGPSGSGKSTLLAMIPRFLDPDTGMVRMDGVNVRDIELRELRRSVAWLPQEPVLLPGSIAENIAYGFPGATRAAVEAAAEQAQVHHFIRRLPRGYDTVVGEGAVRMSVGEKQRLNLARAFLKDAPVLLLDEPTSALDAESEQLVMDALQRLRVGRTTLMVAHRSNTLSLVDRSFRIGTDGKDAE